MPELKPSLLHRIHTTDRIVFMACQSIVMLELKPSLLFLKIIPLEKSD